MKLANETYSTYWEREKWPLFVAWRDHHMACPRRHLSCDECMYLWDSYVKPGEGPVSDKDKLEMNITEDDIMEIIDANHGYLCTGKLFQAIRELLKTRGETLEDDNIEKSSHLAALVRGCRHLSARGFYSPFYKDKDGIKIYHHEAVVYRIAIPDGARSINGKGYEEQHANVGGGDSKDPV